MLNMYQFIKEGSAFKKLEVDELLFVEYTCLQEETKFGIWSDSNYFAFVLSGKKMWKTIEQNYEVEQGDILFIKKGANLTHQFFDDEFCAIFLFIPDEFIMHFLQKNEHFLQTGQKNLSDQDAVLTVDKNDLLSNYALSIGQYFSLSERPDRQLLQLKFEELLLSLCTSSKHQELTDYFVSLCQNETHQLERVMEENYAYNLKLIDYAQLCHMSLSKFKRCFNAHYQTTPAAWLKEKKLGLAKKRLTNSDLPVNQLALECGFEDPSHFIRVFKKRYNCTPHQFRSEQLVS